ncbi:hypothetical protein ACJRO7_027991 [Eucalyptus globulus]|uniref:Uncharacterized protein n=1 Tax=Eucalyptus globulus TaxID=34317 RepID=A0ABD3JWV5_EUCGL
MTMTSCPSYKYSHFHGKEKEHRSGVETQGPDFASSDDMDIFIPEDYILKRRQSRKWQQIKRRVLEVQTEARPQTSAQEALPGNSGGHVSLPTTPTIEQSRDRAPDDVFVSLKK